MKIIIVILCLILSGCGATAGTYTRTPILNPDGTVVKNILGMPVYSRTRASQHVAIANAASEAFKGRRTEPEPPCAHLDDISGLTPTVLKSYFDSVTECERSRGTARLVASALGRPSTASGEVVQGYANIVQSVESGKTQRFNSGVRAIGSLGTSLVIGSAVKAGFDATRDVGIEAARNGNTNIGDVTITPAQSVVNSNDATGGTGAASTASTSTLTGGDINLAIGRGNRSFVTNDASRLNVSGSDTQALEPSANGNVNNGRQNGVNTADQFTGDTTNSDDDGGNGLL